MHYVHTTMESPVGQLTLVGSDNGLAAILWDEEDPQRVRIAPGSEAPHHPVLAETKRQLTEYFAGQRKAFTVPLDFVGTPFQKAVWRELVAIPFGETRSYGDIARRVGRPGASRAVGAANRNNPISIIAPCHRVIGSSGKLTGYAGGLEKKALLLRLEGIAINESEASTTRITPRRPASLSAEVCREPETHAASAFDLAATG